MVDVFLQQCIQHGNDGDEHQHADNAEQTAAQSYGDQNPNGRQADGAADHLRINQIPFNLLQHKEQHDKRSCLRGIYRQNQEGADCTADKCPENRNQCGKRNQNADQHSEGEPQNCHAKEEHGSQNDGFHALPCQKIREGAIGQCADLQKAVCVRLFQIGEKELFHLLSQKVLLQKDIAGENKADEKRPHAADDARCHADGGAEHGICTHTEEGHKLIEDFLPICLCLQLLQIVHQFGMVGEKLLRLLNQRRHLFGQCFPQGCNDACQFGRNHACYQAKQSHHEKQCENQADGSGDPFLFTADLCGGKQVPLDTIHRDAQHEGNRTAEQEGKENM